ncbi:uncharacterized protein LOC128213399 isoform X2 [Mya arenaria]|nr:uncharacterized protein LOC128213399 isoform X2 [Mya arenaria]XP_052775014.1 uncharacterized protein LOC128213399 isoform X2 [Mya arenaria]
MQAATSTKPDGTAIDAPEKSRSNKKSKSNRICCVPECHTTGYDEVPGHGKPSFHKFPGVGNPLRTVWLNKIKRDEGPNFKIRHHTVVCSLHFEENATETFGYSNLRLLKPGAVPTKFECWKNKVHFIKPKATRKPNSHPPKHAESVLRSSSSVNEIPEKDCKISVQPIADSSSNACPSETQAETAEIQRDFLHDHLQFVQNKSNLVLQENENIRNEIDKLKREKHSSFILCVKNLKPSEYPFYTGFPSKEVFDTVLELVNPGKCGENIVMYSQEDNGNETPMIENPQKLSAANQFLLFLCRVRVGLLECDIARRFNISIDTVNMLITTWANFLHLRLGSMNIWPSREQVDKTMPIPFKGKYPTTRVIIECIGIKTEMASSLLSKSQTYSNYKSSNTLKGLIGTAPCGRITFVSQLYWGNIPNREIAQRSGFLGLEFKAGDSVMADKGFDIQDLLDEKDIRLNIPPVLGQYIQKTDIEVKRTQIFGAERIHVERATNKIKNFHIFDQVVPSPLFSSINQIWCVCALMTLFQDPIISCPGIK